MFDTSEARSSHDTGQDCLFDMPDARTRLVATTTMASTLAHEVNQPLTAAANYMHACASRLRSRGEGFEDLLAMIEHASRETLRAAEIIRRMRSFIVTGKIAGRHENLADDDRAGHVRAGASRRDGCRDRDCDSAHAFVVADRIQIEQVFSHLLRNACEALDGRAQPRIAIDATEIGDDIVVRIEDNGPGLSAEALARLFDPHFTSKATGLGLGMPICKTIVEAHGGRIWAENREGGGAAFNVALAAADQPIQQQFG